MLRHRSKTNSRPQENRELRAEYANANPFCERCRVIQPRGFTPMDDVHHLFGGRLGRWDLVSNLLSVCRPCHRWFEENKSEGRIFALWIKHRKNELDEAEIRQASGMFLAGWLALHPSPSPAYQSLSEAYR